MSGPPWYDPTPGEKLGIEQTVPPPSPETPSLPIADDTGVVVDTTTWNNPPTGGPDRVTVLLGAASPPGSDQLILAIGKSGAAFPGWELFADATSGIYLGDGTIDPYGFGANIWLRDNGDGSRGLVFSNRNVDLSVGQSDAIVGPVLQLDKPLQLRVGGNLLTIHTQGGNPNSQQIPGRINDVYIDDQSDGTPLTWIWRCTVTGTAGNATWVGML